jgi:hypothetical protein
MQDKEASDWRVTATTIYCAAVADEVTMMVYRDFTTRCTGLAKYGQSGCSGPDCPSLTEYRDKLAREAAAATVEEDNA